MGEAVDLLVVGAGPGGSNAAAAALAGGLSVLQVDARPFPRVKPCAGGMTVRARRALGPGLAPAARREFEGFEFNLWAGGRQRFSHRAGMLSMVVRSEFDAELVRRNEGVPGFRFRAGERVREVAWTGTSFRVTTEHGVLEARQLVAADGANGTVARALGVRRPRGRAIAVETNLAGTPQREPCFDFGFVPGGYGWVFPKDGHSSVGLYTLEQGRKDLRPRLAEYARAKGFALDEQTFALEAHPVPLGGFGLCAPACPLYVVGDAAGLADALTGEGIYHALESGRLAGETAALVARGRASHRRYYRRLWRRVLPDTFLSFHGARLFYRALGPSLFLLRLPLVWRPLVQGFARGATLTECLLRAPLYLVQSYRAGAERLSRA